MSIIETFTKIIRGKTKTENVRTADYVIGDFPFATPDAISAELNLLCVYLQFTHVSEFEQNL